MANSVIQGSIPYNELIEKTVICCMLNNPETIDEGMVLLSEEYFYSRKCKLIFRSIRELYFEKENIDIITVRNRLLKRTEEELKNANITDKSQINVEYFSDITNIPAVPQSMKKYCDDLREVYVRRKLKSYSERLIQDTMKGEQDVYDLLSYEEAEHAAKFAELLGEVITDSTKKNLEMRVAAEFGATAGKTELAKKAKALGLDAIHDTVHEMARDEARHGKAFKGLLERYFG